MSPFLSRCPKAVKRCASVGPVEQRRIARHEFQAVVEVRRAEDRAGGLAGRVLRVNQLRIFRGHAPIAVGVARHDVVRDEAAHVVDPLDHARIGTGDHLRVAELFVQSARDDDQAAGPGDIVAVERPVGRTHVRDAAVLFLRVHDVLHPLGVERDILKQERLAFRLDRAIAQPTLSLVTLRAIGGNAAIVAAHTPQDIGVDAIDRRLRTGEGPGARQIIVHHAAFDRIQRGTARISGHLHEAKTVVGEARLVGLRCPGP